MTKPPIPENVRLTITVTPEVHAAFQRMAEVSGMSLGRCMGEWLGDTLEGVQFLTAQLEKARSAPRQVVQQMRAGLLGAVDEADAVLADLRSGRLKPPTAGGPGAARRPAAASETPRPVIRGGKSRISGKDEGRNAPRGKGHD